MAQKIGELTRLRLLSLTGCQKLKVIAPNVISCLSRLEELYIGDSFVQWEVERLNNQGPNNASLAELKRLSHLTSLDIRVQDAKIMPHEIMIVEKLERFNIFIGLVWNLSGKCETQRRMLKLKLDNNNHLGYSIKILLKRAEDLYLDELDGFKNVLYELDGEGFSQLKLLHIQKALDLLYIVNSVEWAPCKIAFPLLESLFLYDLINLEKIWHGQLYAESFSKLKIIRIRKCDRLKCLFPFSMAKNLSQLQELEVTDCKNVSEIVGKESEDHLRQAERTSKIIEFTQLHSIILKCLPQLVSFDFNMKAPLISQTSLATTSGSKEIIEEGEPEDSMALFSQKVCFLLFCFLQHPSSPPSNAKKS